MSETMQQSKEQVQMSNQPYTESSALQLRLSVDEILYKLQTLITGKKLEIYYDSDQGTYKQIQKNMGKPLMNDDGVQAIMLNMNCIINTGTVQGNIDSQQYKEYIADAISELAETLTANSYKWGLKDHYLSIIQNSLIAFVRLFITRPIGDGERGSFKDTIRVTETSKVSGEQFAR